MHPCTPAWVTEEDPVSKKKSKKRKRKKIERNKEGDGAGKKGTSEEMGSLQPLMGKALLPLKRWKKWRRREAAGGIVV